MGAVTKIPSTIRLPETVKLVGVEAVPYVVVKAESGDPVAVMTGGVPETAESEKLVVFVVEPTPPKPT